MSTQTHNQNSVQLYSVYFQYTGDDGEDFLSFCYMDPSEAAKLEGHLATLEEQDRVNRASVTPVLKHTSTLTQVWKDLEKGGLS